MWSSEHTLGAHALGAQAIENAIDVGVVTMEQLPPAGALHRSRTEPALQGRQSQQQRWQSPWDIAMATEAEAAEAAEEPKGTGAAAFSPPKPAAPGAIRGRLIFEEPSGAAPGGAVPFAVLIGKVRERLDALEQHQEEMLSELAKVRRRMFGSPGSICVRCAAGHPLVPMGNRWKPTGVAEYSQWSCDGAAEAGGCRNGPKPASHLSALERFHCPACHYDICQACYRWRLRRIAVPRTSEQAAWDNCSPEFR